MIGESRTPISSISIAIALAPSSMTACMTSDRRRSSTSVVGSFVSVNAETVAEPKA